MKSFRNSTERDYVEYKDIYDRGDMLFGFLKEESFIEIDDGKESIVFYCPPIFMKFWVSEDKRIETSTFYVDDEYKVIAFTKDDYQINLNDKGIVFIHEDGNIYYLQLVGNKDDCYSDVSNNGIVIFSQYSKKEDVRVVSKYEHNVWGDSDNIYEQRIEEPYSVSIESKVSKRDKGWKFLGYKNSYYRLDFDVYRNRWQYDIATMKDFGIGAIMARDTYTLQDRKSFSKYYREILSVGSYITITGFPFTRQYDGEEIRDMVRECGFSSEIPEFFIRVYNERDWLIEGHREIIGWYLKNIEHIKVYGKEMGV